MKKQFLIEVFLSNARSSSYQLGAAKEIPGEEGVRCWED